jgi:hypothetical protein
MKIYEGLEHNDLKGLVDNVISVDQYKPKIGNDSETVVVAFTVKYEKPSQDLANFIETSYVEQLDVEASDVPNEIGDYKVFVEFARTPNLFNKIKALIEDINKITSENGVWKYEGFKSNVAKEFSEENFNNDIILTPEEYNFKFKKNNEDIVKERMKFLVNY